MRVTLAAFCVCGAMLGTVVLVDSRFPNGDAPWWAFVAPTLVFIPALGVAMFVFNQSGNRPGSQVKTLQQQIAELESNGQLLRQTFKATRAFGVCEFDDEGPHYFIELDDGRVLYLNGQYLDDYEPIDDDPELNQPRRFPCTEFEIFRHRTEGYVLEINCSGQVLEPETIAEPVSQRELRTKIPTDGQIIVSTTYDVLKSQLLSRK